MGTRPAPAQGAEGTEPAPARDGAERDSRAGPGACVRAGERGGAAGQRGAGRRRLPPGRGAAMGGLGCGVAVALLGALLLAAARGAGERGAPGGRARAAWDPAPSRWRRRARPQAAWTSWPGDERAPGGLAGSERASSPGPPRCLLFGWEGARKEGSAPMTPRPPLDSLPSLGTDWKESAGRGEAWGAVDFGLERAGPARPGTLE